MSSVLSKGQNFLRHVLLHHRSYLPNNGTN